MTCSYTDKVDLMFIIVKIRLKLMSNITTTSVMRNIKNIKQLYKAERKIYDFELSLFDIKIFNLKYTKCIFFTLKSSKNA